MDANSLIDHYFKIKGAYDSKMNALKLRIIRSNDSLANKKARISKIRAKCIHCDQDGGTIFSRSNRHLKATCGSKDSPCNLNIDIKLGSTELIDVLESNVRDDLNMAKTKIIEIKLMLLFGILSEDQMAEAFVNIKDSYKNLIAAQNSILSEMNKQQLITIKDIGGERDVERKALASANEVKLGNLISDFKKLIKEYEEDSSVDTKRAKMMDAIDIYISQIIPTVNTIRTTLYRINTVLEEKGKYKLIQIKTPLSLQVFNMEEPEIIHNKK